jgi:glycosyltransferase involved in cell wall biosynthesis
LFIMSIALGGCLKGPPIEFGLTEDTGGHITYALGAAQALAQRGDVNRVEIVTRLIEDGILGAAYAVRFEPITEKLAIRRIGTADRQYLCKGAAAADRPAFAAALIAHIATLERRPDVIHAHFADAADVAAAVRDRFGIPFLYTAHSLGIDKANHATGLSEAIAPRIADENRAIAAADAIIASSRDEAERQLMAYPAACPAKIHCVPPGAGLAHTTPSDLTRARALIAPFLRDPDKPMILAIARPVAKKNLGGLIDLFAADAGLRDRANLVIVAGLRDGPHTGEDEQRSVIAGLLAGLDRHDLYGTLALPKRQRCCRALRACPRNAGHLRQSRADRTVRTDADRSGAARAAGRGDVSRRASRHRRATGPRHGRRSARSRELRGCDHHIARRRDGMGAGVERGTRKCAGARLAWLCGAVRRDRRGSCHGRPGETAPLAVIALRYRQYADGVHRRRARHGGVSRG